VHVIWYINSRTPRRSPDLGPHRPRQLGNTTTAHLGTVSAKPVPVIDVDPSGDADAWNRGAEQSGEYGTVMLDPPPGDRDLIDPAHPIHRGADR
jgi:hypothetical protein